MDFEALVSPYLNDLYKYCMYLAGSKWDGEDLYQETLLKTYVYSSQIANDRSVRALLFKSAKNLWIDDYRKRRSRVTISDAMHTPAYRDTDYATVRGLLEELAGRLPARYMELLLLSDMYDYSMQEIAGQTDSTVSAVKCALHRARSLLRKGAARRGGYAAAYPQIERWTQAIMYDRPIAMSKRRPGLSTVS